jgi:ABC-type spermidine/putrescine transport system permease subunit II
LCFILSFRELTGTLLVTPPGVETLGVRIYSLYHYGAGQLVAALSVFMVAGMLLVSAAALLVYRGLRRC